MLLSPRHNPHAPSLRLRSVSPRPGSRRPLLSDTPLPSPSLPSILPRHGKRKPSRFGRKIVRVILWLLGFSILLYSAASIIIFEHGPGPVHYLSGNGKAYDIVEQDVLPDFPTPLVVTDHRGRQRWTVSIPEKKSFPLKPAEYRQICSQATDVALHVEDFKKGNTEHIHHAHHSYLYQDPNYMDIVEAQTHGILPDGSATKKHDIWTNMLESDAVIESMGGSTDATSRAGEVCAKSMTYVMESEDAGMGPTLMGLWLAYGLAQKEERAFFVDDTNWAYGSYETYFKPPPKPGCLAPPKTQITPCPHQARHLLVSAATTYHTFGGQFNNYYEDGRKMGVARQDVIFGMMRTGYEALFDLAGEDGDYLAMRVESLNSTIRGNRGVEIGIHVRHGDRHPMEFQYQGSYLPLSKYLDGAREVLSSTFGSAGPNGGEDMEGEMASKVLLASDDPEVYRSVEMSHTIRAQDRITLASKNSGATSTTPTGIDDNVGWEGGFFQEEFWSLGLPSAGRRRSPEYSPPASFRRRSDPVEPPDSHANPPTDVLRLRELVGRAYLLDLAVLGQSDAIICATSSYGCRILAVMMGWENAMDRGLWKNVDGSFDWRGLGWG